VQRVIALGGEVALGPSALVVSPVRVGTGAGEGRGVKLEVLTLHALDSGLGQTLATIGGFRKASP